MVNKISTWVKTHKLLTFNILVVALILWRYLGYLPKPLTGSISSQNYNSGFYPEMPSAGIASPTYKMYEPTPQPNVIDRKVALNSNFSLLVKNVTETVEIIKDKTLQLAGYIVNTNINRSEYGESATLVIRVPYEKVDEMSKYLRTISVKVVSENVDGRDVTDEYIDIERRLSDLEAQRVRMMAILDKATTVQEILNVQNSIDQIQDRIDNYKGQLLYLDGITKTSKLTIYISTDELGLPYTPQKSWRPDVIFKQAVRAMLETLQKIGTVTIWIAVYSPIIAGFLLIIGIVRKIISKKRAPKL